MALQDLDEKAIKEIAERKKRQIKRIAVAVEVPGLGKLTSEFMIEGGEAEKLYTILKLAPWPPSLFLTIEDRD